MEAAELDVAETVGRLMHFWGFKRPMGRLWTILYLSPHPRSAADLAELLHMSSGGVSMALAELEKWGCIQRTWVPGDRRDYFVAESDIWQMVQRVLRERELRLVEDFGHTLRRASAAVATAAATPSPGNPSTTVWTRDEPDELGYKRQRLGRLVELTQVGQTLLGALVAGGTVDPTRLIKTAASASAPPTQDPKPPN